MSRIHEALKKAEQERAAVQVSEADPVTPEAVEVAAVPAFSTIGVTPHAISDDRHSSVATVPPIVCSTALRYRSRSAA